MSTELVLSIAGASLLICLSIIGWLIGMVIKESRQNTLEVGMIKGAIEANKEKAHDDNQSLERETNTKIQHVTDDVKMLANSVNKLMDLFLTKQNKG